MLQELLYHLQRCSVLLRCRCLALLLLCWLRVLWLLRGGCALGSLCFGESRCGMREAFFSDMMQNDTKSLPRTGQSQDKTL